METVNWKGVRATENTVPPVNRNQLNAVIKFEAVKRIYLHRNTFIDCVCSLYVTATNVRINSMFLIYMWGSSCSIIIIHITYHIDHTKSILQWLFYVYWIQLILIQYIMYYICSWFSTFAHKLCDIVIQTFIQIY